MTQTEVSWTQLELFDSELTPADPFHVAREVFESMPRIPDRFQSPDHRMTNVFWFPNKELWENISQAPTGTVAFGYADSGNYRRAQTIVAKVSPSLYVFLRYVRNGLEAEAVSKDGNLHPVDKRFLSRKSPYARTYGQGRKEFASFASSPIAAVLRSKFWDLEERDRFVGSLEKGYHGYTVLDAALEVADLVSWVESLPEADASILATFLDDGIPFADALAAVDGVR